MAIRVLLAKPIFHLFTKSSPKSNFQLPNSNPMCFSTKPQNPTHTSQQFSKGHTSKNSLFSLFQRYGFPESQLHDFISKNPFLLNSKCDDIEKAIKILFSLNLCQESVVFMVFRCPRVLEFDFMKKCEMGIPQIGVLGLSSLAVQSVIEACRQFDCMLYDVSRGVKRVKRLGFSDVTISRVLEECPDVIIFVSSEGIREKVEFLEGIGIQRNGVDWIVGKFPEVLAFGLENRLRPLFDEFMHLGFSLVEVKREILREPRVLGLEVGELSQCMRMLRSLKCRMPVMEKIYFDGAFRAGYEVKLRVDCICKYGLIRRDAFTVLWKEPRVILYGIRDIEKKIEYLVDKMKFDITWLVDVPDYLGVSFEKQIVPRYNVIEYLRSKGGIGDEVGLKSLVKLSRMKFHNLYVKPYPECEQLYGRYSGEVEQKKQHPAGMWKLFKPPKYPESKEDAKSIRYFMEPWGQVNRHSFSRQKEA